MHFDKKLFEKNSIDIEYLFNKLYSKRLKIIFLILISTFFTTAPLLFFSKKNINVSLPYKVQLNSLANDIFCEVEVSTRCKQIKDMQFISDVLDGKWDKDLDLKGRSYYLVEELPLQFSRIFKNVDDLKNLRANLNIAEETIRKKYLNEQRMYLNYISNLSNDAVLSTNSYVESYLDTKKIIGLLETGTKPIKFLEFYISDVNFKPSLEFNYPFESISNISQENKQINSLKKKKNNIISRKFLKMFLRLSILFAILIITFFSIFKK